MAKITRKTAKIFGSSAAAAPLGIAQFGSEANGAVAYSTDPAVIQSLSQWLGGWNPALVGGASPNLEDMNAVHYVNSYQVAYLLQQGLPEYDPGTTYYTNSLCSFNGISYISLVDTNVGNQPDVSPASWSATKNNYWAGTDTGQVNGYAVSGVTGFPANANIPNGTTLAFIASTTNTGSGGDCTLSVNSQSNLFIRDSSNIVLQYGQIKKGQTVVLIYTPNGWMLVNPAKFRRQWALLADLTGANCNFSSQGFVQGSFTLTGTGGSFLTTGPNFQGSAAGAPASNIQTDNTSGHQAKYTTTNLAFPVYATMNLFVHCNNLVATGAAQSFIGYAGGDPILNASDPLANLTGFGIWFKWTSGTSVQVALVNNNGSASSTITDIFISTGNVDELFFNLSLAGGVITLEGIKGSTQTVVSANTKVPVAGATTILTIKPYFFIQTNSSTVLQQQVCEIYGDYGT